MAKSFRVEFQVIAFATADVVSPQRIEERMQAAIQEIILDQPMTPVGEAFGYVKDVSVQELSLKEKE